MDYTAIGIQLTVTGMTIVFSGLFIMFVMMNIFQVLDNWLSTRAARKQETQPATESQPAASPDEIPAEVLAALSAAAMVALGKKVRVRRIRYRTKEETTTWSRQGRVTIMGSHVTKR